MDRFSIAKGIELDAQDTKSETNDIHKKESMVTQITDLVKKRYGLTGILGNIVVTFFTDEKLKIVDLVTVAENNKCKKFDNNGPCIGVVHDYKMGRAIVRMFNG